MKEMVKKENAENEILERTKAALLVLVEMKVEHSVDRVQRRGAIAILYLLQCQCIDAICLVMLEEVSVRCMSRDFSRRGCVCQNDNMASSPVCLNEVKVMLIIEFVHSVHSTVYKVHRMHQFVHALSCSSTRVDFL